FEAFNVGLDGYDLNGTYTAYTPGLYVAMVFIDQGNASDQPLDDTCMCTCTCGLGFTTNPLTGDLEVLDTAAGAAAAARGGAAPAGTATTSGPVPPALVYTSGQDSNAIVMLDTALPVSSGYDQVEASLSLSDPSGANTWSPGHVFYQHDTVHP